MILEARDLIVRYPAAARPAVDGVSLGVEPGSLVALGGPNGSGKTTMLRAFLGLLEPAGGSATVKGRPAAGWPKAELARSIGVVAQREELWVPLSVEEVVLLGRYPRLGALSPITAEDRGVVERALARCDVLDLRTRSADTLSGGEWQRVRIARALAQEPECLVLDEPATALDVRHEMEVMELIRTLVGDGLGCLLITHHLNLAARYADRVVLLDRGRMAAAGPPADVLREEVIARVFRWPVAVQPWRDGTPQFTPLRPREQPPGT
jgi:iron complex transport system ATP-binding protein